MAQRLTGPFAGPYTRAERWRMLKWRVLMDADSWYHRNHEPWWAFIVCDVFDWAAGVDARTLLGERWSKIAAGMKYSRDGLPRQESNLEPPD